MNRTLVVTLVLLLAPAVHADYTVEFIGKVTEVSGNIAFNFTNGTYVDLAPGLLGTPFQGSLTLFGPGPTYTEGTVEANLGRSEGGALYTLAPVHFGDLFANDLRRAYGSISPPDSYFYSPLDNVHFTSFSSSTGEMQFRSHYYSFQFHTDWEATVYFTFVPEPTSLLLLGVGLAGLGSLAVFRRRTAGRNIGVPV